MPASGSGARGVPWAVSRAAPFSPAVSAVAWGVRGAPFRAFSDRDTDRATRGCRPVKAPEADRALGMKRSGVMAFDLRCPGP